MELPSAIPTLALAALLTGLVPAPEARAEPEKPATGDETATEDAGIPSEAERRAEKARRSLAARAERAQQELATHRVTVAERTRTLGPDHTDTLAARRDLADALYFGGKWLKEPAALLEEEQVERRAVLARVRHMHGHENPATFDDWNALARSYCAAGESTEAEQEYRALIAAMEMTFGPEHGITLQMRANLAGCLAVHCKSEATEVEYRAILAIYERLQKFGRARDLRSDLAEMLYKEGRFGEAEIEIRLILAATEAQVGFGGLVEIHWWKTLARCLLGQGKLREAVGEFEHALALGQDFLREDHDEIRKITRLLAEARKALAKEAEEKPAPAPAPPASGEEKAETLPGE